MRKIVLAVLLIAAIFSAKAWNTAYDKAVYLVAAQNYNPKTLRLVQHYVNEDVAKASNHLSWHRKNGRHLESAGWHKLHLDASLHPAAKDENDAYVQIEKALEILSKYESDSRAWNSIGACMMQLERVEEAITWFEKAIEAGSAEARENLKYLK